MEEKKIVGKNHKFIRKIIDKINKLAIDKERKNTCLEFCSYLLISQDPFISTALLIDINRDLDLIAQEHKHLKGKIKNIKEKINFLKKENKLERNNLSEVNQQKKSYRTESFHENSENRSPINIIQINDKDDETLLNHQQNDTQMENYKNIGNLRGMLRSNYRPLFFGGSIQESNFIAKGGLNRVYKFSPYDLEESNLGKENRVVRISEWNPNPDHKDSAVISQRLLFDQYLISPSPFVNNHNRVDYIKHNGNCMLPIFSINKKCAGSLKQKTQTDQKDTSLHIKTLWYSMIKGVSEVHKNGFLHTDIKTENFLSVDDFHCNVGYAKISDLDSVQNIKTVTVEDASTKTGSFCLQSYKKVDFKHDKYALLLSLIDVYLINHQLESGSHFLVRSFKDMHLNLTVEFQLQHIKQWIEDNIKEDEEKSFLLNFVKSTLDEDKSLENILLDNSDFFKDPIKRLEPIERRFAEKNELYSQLLDKKISETDLCNGIETINLSEINGIRVNSITDEYDSVENFSRSLQFIFKAALKIEDWINTGENKPTFSEKEQEAMRDIFTKQMNKINTYGKVVSESFEMAVFLCAKVVPGMEEFLNRIEIKEERISEISTRIEKLKQEEESTFSFV